MFWVENNHQINQIAGPARNTNEVPFDLILQSLESSLCETSHGSLLILVELALFHPKVFKIYKNLFSALREMNDADLVGSDSDRRNTAYEQLKKLDDLIGKFATQVTVDQSNANEAAESVSSTNIHHGENNDQPTLDSTAALGEVKLTGQNEEKSEARNDGNCINNNEELHQQQKEEMGGKEERQEHVEKGEHVQQHEQPHQQQQQQQPQQQQPQQQQQQRQQLHQSQEQHQCCENGKIGNVDESRNEYRNERTAQWVNEVCSMENNDTLVRINSTTSSMVQQNFDNRATQTSPLVRTPDISTTCAPVSGGYCPFDINVQLGERYCLMKDIVRYEKLSIYYTDLLNEKPPYAPVKYRLKVRKNTPEKELALRREQTADVVKFEIKIMIERASSKRELLKQVDERIEMYLDLNRDRRSLVMETIRNDDREIADNFERYYFAKKRETDRRMKENLTDHLLTYINDDIDRQESCPVK